MKRMGSIRKPKRLVFHGHDEKEYFFLVKVGGGVQEEFLGKRTATPLDDSLFLYVDRFTRAPDVPSYKLELGGADWEGWGAQAPGWSRVAGTSGVTEDPREKWGGGGAYALPNC